MAESKRTFQSAKIDRDTDERVLAPGEYRDALNVSVDFSEDGNVGAIENLKGNELISNQNILGLSSTSNPNAKVIGTYANPESDKIYYFVTGNNSDGIFEYDATAGTVSTVIIDSSIAPPTPVELDFQFTTAGAQASVAKNGAITVSSLLGDIESVTEDFNETVGTTTQRGIDTRVKVPTGYSNRGLYVYGKLTANQAPISAPEVIQDEPSLIASTSFTLNGRYTNDSAALTDIGFYWIVNTGGSSTINVYTNKFVVTEGSVKNNNALLGEVFPRVIDPFDGVADSDIIVIDKNNTTVSASTYTFEVSQGNNPAEINFSTLPNFPVTVAQASTATTLTNAYTAAQVQASGTQVSLSSAITSPFSAPIPGQTQGTQIASVAYATNSAGTTLSDVKYFTLATSTVNRMSGTEYVVVPVVSSANTVSVRNVGYGSFVKADGITYLATAGPDSTGTRANQANLQGDVPITFNPTGPTFAQVPQQLAGVNFVSINNMAANTSYQVTMGSTSGNFNSKTIRINNGSPTGTYYTSILSLNITGLQIAQLSINQYDYNRGTTVGPSATYPLGPVAAGETAQAVIPLDLVGRVVTSGTYAPWAAPFDPFDPTKLTVTVFGKTEGVDFSYYVEDTSTAGIGLVPGIIFEGTPSLLGANPTVVITYTH